MEKDKNVTLQRQQHSTLKTLLSSNAASVFLFWIVLVIILNFTTSNFVTRFNFEVIIGSMAVTAMTGLSQMVVISTGGMNVSIGAIGGLSAAVSAMLMQELGAGTALSILVGLLVGLICGLLNGIMIYKIGSTGAASFLVTLATTSVFKGINLGFTHAQPYYNLQPSFKALGSAQLLGIPVLLIFLILIAVILAFVFHYMSIGKQFLAYGANDHAAILYGVSKRRVVLLANTIGGLLAGAAGLMLLSRLGSSQNDIGDDWMVFSFAAPIIGGTRQTGGKISVFGTLVGALLLATINNALIHLNISVYWNTLIEGLLIMAAVLLDKFKNKPAVKG